MVQNKLINLANHLDKIGMHEEATFVDGILEDFMHDVDINKLSLRLVATLEENEQLQIRVLELEEVLRLISNPYSN